MTPKITNEVIVERIGNLKDTMCNEFKDVNAHLKTLNSQVEKNTKFRVGATTVIKVLGWGLGGGGLLTLIVLFMKAGGVG